MKVHQNLLETHFNPSRFDNSGMELDSIQQSPPPFMSPVDSPVHRPSTPQQYNIPPDTTLSLDALVESEKRVKNRLWREGRASLGQTNVPARPRDGSHVDKKIEATLPKVEPFTAARSRKASQYMRLFKENDAAEEGKKRERRPPEKAHQPIPEEGAARPESVNNRRPGLSRSSSIIQSPQQHPMESYFDATPGPENEAKMVQSPEPLAEASRNHEIPLRLLEEIRNYHNLTPGADRGSSFSRSLPTAAAEKLLGHTVNGRASQVRESTDYFQPAQDQSGDRSPGSEEDESEREQISSALYFPHRGLNSSEPIPQEEVIRKTEIEKIRERKSFSAGQVHKSRVAEETVKSPQEIEISLQSQDTSQYLHGDIPKAVSASEDETKPLTTTTVEATTSAESENESLAESSLSLPDEDSSATDDLGSTPTATTRKKKNIAAPIPHPPAPLGAVELKPFDHQVGGHTTVYRFSRRAVCKQLNNRENEFYETVERHHAELLEFLPRYDISFIQLSNCSEAETSAKISPPF